MRIIPFWTRLLLTLKRAWIPSSPIPLRHQNWTHPWMSLMPLHLQSLLGFSTWLVPFLIILNCSLLLALHLINCGARLGPSCPWFLTTKMASKLICYFSSHPTAFGFWSSTPLDNITLTSNNRKADQNISDVQTGFGAATHAILDTEQLISHFRVALVDTLFSLPDSEGGVIPVSKVHELLLEVYAILDSVVSKWVVNQLIF